MHTLGFEGLVLGSPATISVFPVPPFTQNTGFCSLPYHRMVAFSSCQLRLVNAPSP